MAESPGRNRRGWLRRLVGRKHRHEPQAASANDLLATSSVSSNGPTATNSLIRDGLSTAGPSTVKPLWDRAYEALGKQSPSLTGQYEDLLRQASTSENAQIAPTCSAASGHGIAFDRARLLEISEKGIAEMEEKRAGFSIGNLQIAPKEQIANAAELALKVKDLVGEAVKASPEASIAWAGICLALPLLTNPITAEEANRDGFFYVTARMHYYTALEPLVERLGNGSPDALSQAYESIVALYQAILDYQIRSALRFYQHSFKRCAGDVLRSEAWSKKREDIEALEATVERNLRQINELKARQTLESLDGTCTASFETLQGLLGFSKQQLRATEDQRDIAQRQLLLQQEESQLYQFEKEEKCRQLFRLTSGDKDATYEWYKDRVEKRVEGTCQWLLDHDNFRDWLSEESGILLVSADPGCGKSVLAKYLIDQVLQPPTVCYFFFKDQDQNTVRQSLCALLHQLFSQKPFLIEHAMAEFSNNGIGLINTTASLWKVFDGAVRDPRAGAVVVVLDALDECAETEFEDLVRHIQSRFLEDSPGSHKLKFLFTSRPYDQIVSEFRPLFNAIPKIHIPGEEHSEAIGREVNLVIDNRAKSLGLSPRLTTYLTGKLLEIPHRTYLWVHLVFDNLKTGGFKKTPKGVDSMIEKLPKNVYEAYEQILEKSTDLAAAQKALAVILAAQRPLTLSEMNVAVNIQDDHQAFSDLDVEEDKDFKTTLRSWCGLFVSIHHGKVYFLHQTAREFLLVDTSNSAAGPSTLRWYQSIGIKHAHTVLAEKCILYLALFNSTDNGHESSNNAFLDYSAIHWGSHFREAAIVDDTISFSRARIICRTDSVSYTMWFKIFWEEISWQHIPGFSDLCVSSYLGHTAIVERILATEKVDPDSKDTVYGRTPLSWAAGQGYESIVKLLLATGTVDIDSEDNRGQRPLSWAAQNGNENIVQLLLASGNVDVNSKNKRGRTPLSFAAENGSETIVGLLLATGEVDINPKESSWRRTPLSLAAAEGHETVVKLLLANENVDINSKDRNGRAPLTVAINKGHEAVFRVLLAGENVDVDSKDKTGRTPLSWAAEEGLEACAKLLLATGNVDIDSKDKENRTPLSFAAEDGHETIVKLLLATGKVDINSKDTRGRTPLSWAARKGRDAVVSLLLATADVDIDSEDNDGRVPLSWAVEKGHKAIVPLLEAYRGQSQLLSSK